MNPTSLRLGIIERAVFVGAARPHTPRLQSPPQQADAKRKLPRQGDNLRLRTINNGIHTIKGITKESGQLILKRYSSQLGGSIFDELLVQYSVGVSKEQ